MPCLRRIHYPKYFARSLIESQQPGDKLEITSQHSNEDGGYLHLVEPEQPAVSSSSRAGIESIHKPQRFKCSEPGCTKDLKHKKNLARHLITHSTKKPYACLVPGCLCTFARSDTLRNHYIGIHGKRGGRGRYLSIFDKTSPDFIPKIHYPLHATGPPHFRRSPFNAASKPFRCAHAGCIKAYTLPRNVRRHELSCQHNSPSAS